ncbi:MAG: hypothetical protein ACTTJ6_01200 [Treponema sp.]
MTVSNYVPLQTISYSALPRVSAGGRAYMAVNSSQMIYAHFKYVTGVPAGEGQSGATVDKLSILNSLIDRLVTAKQTSMAEAKATKEVLKQDDVSEAQIDRLVQYYLSEIKRFNSIKANFGYNLLGQADPIVNLTA